MPLINVRSERHDDCGIAAFATATKLSYEKAVQILFKTPQHKLKDFRVSRKQICRSLLKIGLKAKPTKNFRKEKQPVLFTLQWEKNEGGHCVVWDPKRKRILDPGFSYLYSAHPLSFYLTALKREGLPPLVIKKRKRRRTPRF